MHLRAIVDAFPLSIGIWCALGTFLNPRYRFGHIRFSKKYIRRLTATTFCSLDTKSFHHLLYLVITTEHVYGLDQFVFSGHTSDQYSWLFRSQKFRLHQNKPRPFCKNHKLSRPLQTHKNAWWPFRRHQTTPCHFRSHHNSSLSCHRSTCHHEELYSPHFIYIFTISISLFVFVTTNILWRFYRSQRPPTIFPITADEVPILISHLFPSLYPDMSTNLTVLSVCRLQPSEIIICIHWSCPYITTLQNNL